MPLPHRFSAALACLAVVLHLLLAPLSGVLTAEDKRAFGFGGHCETAQQLTDHAHHLSPAVNAVTTIDEPADDASLTGIKCCCGASAVSLATLLVSACHAPTPPPVRHRVYQTLAQTWVSPHWYWPKLNPRASPLV